MLIEEPGARPSTDVRTGTYLYYRHTLPVRVMHWINAIALTILLLSGLNIFSAHPALYWGKSSYTGRPPVFEIAAREDAEGDLLGVTRIFGTGAVGPLVVSIVLLAVLLTGFARRLAAGRTLTAEG